jgi:hypothetical protein
MVLMLAKQPMSNFFALNMDILAVVCRGKSGTEWGVLALGVRSQLSGFDINEALCDFDRHAKVPAVHRPNTAERCS